MYWEWDGRVEIGRRYCLVGYLFRVVFSKVVNKRNQAVRQEKTFQPHNSTNEQSKGYSSNQLSIFFISFL